MMIMDMVRILRVRSRRQAVIPGIIGVAPRAIIHPVKAFDQNGSAYVSDIIAGIDWCVQNDLDIINMSFGMKTYNPTLEQAVLNAYYRGKVIVASPAMTAKRKPSITPPGFPRLSPLERQHGSARLLPSAIAGSKLTSMLLVSVFIPLGLAANIMSSAALRWQQRMSAVLSL